MTNQKVEMTPAERYRAQTKPKEAAIVDVTCSVCGSICQFEKPSKFGMLFGMGNLPTTATSLALEDWKEDGILEIDEDGGPDNDQLQLIKTTLSLRDRVLKLSRSPKLVVGKANEAKGELSTDDVEDCCLTYWFKWVAAGGEVSAMLGTFPKGPPSSSVARPNRKARRAAAK